MELSEREKKMVLEGRAIESREEKGKDDLLHLLDVTGRYAAWLIENGASSTYSTFWNDFGCELSNVKSRSLFYKRVLNVMNAAKCEVVG